MVATQYFKINFSVQLTGDWKIVLSLSHDYWLKIDGEIDEKHVMY